MAIFGNDERKTEVYQIRLKKTEKEELMEMAKANNMTLARLIKNALNDYVEKLNKK